MDKSDEDRLATTLKEFFKEPPPVEDLKYSIAFEARCLKKALRKAMLKNRQEPDPGFTVDISHIYNKYLRDVEVWEASRSTTYPDLDPDILNITEIREALGNESILKRLLLAKLNQPRKKPAVQHTPKQSDLAGITECCRAVYPTGLCPNSNTSILLKLPD